MKAQSQGEQPMKKYNGWNDNKSIAGGVGGKPGPFEEQPEQERGELSTRDHLKIIKMLTAYYAGKKLFIECFPTDAEAIHFPNSNRAVKEIEWPENFPQPSKVQEEEIEELKKEVEKWKDEYGAMERIIADYQVADQKLKNSIESARELIFQYWRKEHPDIPSYRIQDEWELFKSENKL